MVTIENEFKAFFPNAGNLTFEQMVDFFGADVTTGKKRSMVIHRELLAPGQPVLDLYFKIYGYRRKPLKRFLRKPKSMTESHNLHFFASIGIAVPQVIALGTQRNWWGKVVADFIITRTIPDTLVLKEFVLTHCPNPHDLQHARCRRHLIATIARQTRVMHQRDFLHQDLKWRNILVRQAPDAMPEVFWIDCPSGYRDRLRLRRHRGRVKDLATMDELANQLCTLRERLYFLTCYLGDEASSSNLRNLASAIDRYRRKRID